MSTSSSVNSINEVDNALKRKQPSGSQSALRSKVWFEFTRSEDKQRAICNHCKEDFRVNRTSSLRNHLMRCPMKKQSESGQPSSMANDELNDDDDYCSTIRISL
ncbi:hypothetical protein FRX31_023760 [Thalictrum thalictroides]|uniref:BED-type domain-containing protein n=1 Tax=Thalictrum thalictroides TaxID=46969 RepID=A0A7J6VP32_THATH|nr:hypothetical protein FRX31_023760 [Thalictrum thalictroides]